MIGGALLLPLLAEMGAAAGGMIALVIIGVVIMLGGILRDSMPEEPLHMKRKREIEEARHQRRLQNIYDDTEPEGEEWYDYR